MKCWRCVLLKFCGVLAGWVEAVRMLLCIRSFEVLRGSCFNLFVSILIPGVSWAHCLRVLIMKVRKKLLGSRTFVHASLDRCLRSNTNKEPYSLIKARNQRWASARSKTPFCSTPFNLPGMFISYSRLNCQLIMREKKSKQCLVQERGKKVRLDREKRELEFWEFKKERKWKFEPVK